MENQDRDNVAIQIERMLNDASPLPSDEWCIYKVPDRLRKLNPNAYTPKIVSIGPFHHGNITLQKMEAHKHIYCHKFIERSEVSLDDLVNLVRELEPRVRRCYSENIKLSVEEFIKVIVVDCCFTLEFLLRGTEDTSKPWLLMDITWDLMLIENQLPFFVFHKIFELAFRSRLSGSCEPFLKLVSDWLPMFGENEGTELPSIENIKHFLDLHRYNSLQPLNNIPERGNKSMTLHLSATELKEAGVKFRVNKESNRFLDLHFSGNYLRIPKFRVEDDTEMILRNMIAFEQCHPHENPYFTDYVELMDCLINTEKDVDILVNKGIIINWLGDNKSVARMFNGLVKNVDVGTTNIEYLRICEGLNAYYNHWWHKGMATLRRDYCSTPWKVVASIAAIILLLLTITQTIFSILQVV